MCGLQNAFHESTIPSTMSATYRRRMIVIIIAVAAAVVIALFFYVLLRAGGSGAPAEPGLQGAIRQGSADFEQYKSKIVVDEPEAEEAKRALGDIVMSLHSTVRNFTGRTLNGLEIRAAVMIPITFWASLPPCPMLNMADDTNCNLLNQALAL